LLQALWLISSEMLETRFRYVILWFYTPTALFCYQVDHSAEFHQNQAKITPYSVPDKILLNRMEEFLRPFCVYRLQELYISISLRDMNISIETIKRVFRPRAGKACMKSCPVLQFGFNFHRGITSYFLSIHHHPSSLPSPSHFLITSNSLAIQAYSPSYLTNTHTAQLRFFTLQPYHLYLGL